MIRKSEIKEKARKHGVPLSTIQRDYAQDILLDSLFSVCTDMAFKGGTCIKKMYIENYRFSDDLDFTLLSDIDVKTLDEIIHDTVDLAKEKTMVEFSRDIKVETNPNGYLINTYFKDLTGGKNRIKIKMDVTESDKENIIFPFGSRMMIHQYQDALESEIITYSLEEIMAEKMRSLFQRTRPRDLYDVYQIWDRLDIDEVVDAFDKKCKFKKIEPNTQELESREDDFKKAWKNSLKNQLRELPDFQDVFSNVLMKLNKHI